jgi:hypothetical protein
LASRQELGLWPLWTRGNNLGRSVDFASDGQNLTRFLDPYYERSFDIAERNFKMLRGVLLWLIGLPLPIILILWLMGYLS